jgi:putative ABC transport system permease protein
MVVSALLRASLTDLTRRKARTLFSVATLGLAVASIALLGVPSLLDRAMQTEVRAERLAHLTMTTEPLPLSDEELEALAALPNVEAVEARGRVDARVLVGDRRARGMVIGVRDFARQGVDIVYVSSGATPAQGEVLVDVQDANQGVYGGGAGDVVRILDTSGSERSLRISGEARNLGGGQEVAEERFVVLYATADTVASLSGEPGFSLLAFRLRDTRPGAVTETVEAVRRSLERVPGFSGFTDLPEVRASGDWPGKGDSEVFGDFFGVVTLLALLSALVLIANTMTTLVSEQTGEIGIMRAVGGRRRQIAFVYVKTALLLGVLGTLVGIALGIAISNLLAAFFGSRFFAIDVGFRVDTTVLVVSIAVGLLWPVLAALPAIRRGVRIDLREALESTGSAVGGQDAADRLLRRVHFLPRAMQIGLRGVGRRKRRSLATVLIVALAVANLLATLGLAAASTKTVRAAWGEHEEDVRIWTSGSTVFDERAVEVIRSTEGVAEAQPALVNDVELAGEEASVWGVSLEPLLRYEIAEGRWFSAGEEQARERVAVIEQSLAGITGTHVGDLVSLSTAQGTAQFRIVGIATNLQEDGTVLFVPLTTLRALLGKPTGVSSYWVKTTSPEHSVVDRTTTRLEERLGALGYDIGGEITYVKERDEVAAYRTITTSIAVLGFLIVAIGMVGLANTITMSIIERTREIGVLRCVGARARDVRRIFATEVVALALAGWLLGVPLGYALDRLLVWLVKEVVHVEIPVVFPPWNIAIALAGTVALALLITLLPIRRAVRFRPGDALRYA